MKGPPLPSPLGGAASPARSPEARENAPRSRALLVYQTTERAVVSLSEILENLKSPPFGAII
jgi:hypothetical protein